MAPFLIPGLGGAKIMIADYPWGRSYKAAILETDRSKLAEQIRVAEQAITNRLQELNSDHGGTPEEQAAIRDALSGLNMLRKELSQKIPEANLGRTAKPGPTHTGNSKSFGEDYE